MRRHSPYPYLPLLGLCAVLCLTGPALAAPAPDAVDPRSLPSLQVVWQWGERYVPSLVVDGGTVYALGVYRDGSY